MANKWQKSNIDKVIPIFESKIRIINKQIQTLLDERYVIEQNLQELYLLKKQMYDDKNR